MSSHRISAAGALLLLGAAAMPALEASAATTVAVMDFQDKTSGSAEWKRGSADDTGRDLARKLEAALQRTGKFTIVQPSAVDPALAGADAPAQGSLESPVEGKPDSGAAVRYVIHPSATLYGVEQDTDGVDLPGIKVGTTETEGTAAVELKVVDAATNQVVATVVGSSKSEGEKQLGLPADEDSEDVSTEGDPTTQAILDEAAERAIEQAVQELARTLP